MARRVACFLVFLVLATLPGQATDVMRSTFPVTKSFQACHDIRGRTVSLLRFDEMGDVGRAVILNRLPFIILNPRRLSTLPPKLQTFFFEHECAHHVLGHNYQPTVNVEREADCFAVKSGRDAGLFTRQDILAFKPWIAPLRGTSRGHLPGPDRLRNLLACFDDQDKDSEDLSRLASVRAAARAHNRKDVRW
jgi:hypothetical protein